MCCLSLSHQSESDSEVAPSLLSRAEQSARASNSYHTLAADQLLCPGFIDTHTHASQYSFMGVGRLPLLEWLEKYTFPTEVSGRPTAAAVLCWRL